MKTFSIAQPDEGIKEALIHKINNLTKPKGSLGRLEEIALRIGLIQQTLSPKLTHPQNVLFAGDHGIIVENVTPTPKEVTWQQVAHYIRGGAGINFLCNQHHFDLKIVDAGVDFDFPKDKGIIDKKVRKGTRNYLYEPAMTVEELDQCFISGAEVVDECYAEGSNILSFGEMGASNTSSSSIWMSLLTGIPLAQCVGAGSGLHKEGIQHKYLVLKQAIENYKGDFSTLDIMRYFGGYELVMAVGAMLRAAELKITILIDGFIMSACILAAQKLYPNVLPYAIFAHCGDEGGHKLLLDTLHANPILNLNLRLGEGTGAVCAFPIVDSAVRMINEMDSFTNASVTKYF